MANVVSRIEEAISLFQRAKEAMAGVTSTLTDSREAVSERNLDKLKAMLEREEMETREARADLASAIADYRKNRAA